MNQLEIEYKFKVQKKHIKRLVQKLDTLCVDSWKIKKSDIYYRFNNLDNFCQNFFDLRCRTSIIERNNQMDTIHEITFKNRLHSSHNNKAEINKEYESQVEDLNVLKMMCKILGAQEYITKEKQGHSYTMNLITNSNYEITCLIELIEVTHLGYFLEMECLVDEDILPSTMYPTLEEIQDTLKHFAFSLGLKEEMIEPKLYMEMLKKNSRS